MSENPNDKVKLGDITPLEEIPAGLRVKIYRNISSYYAARNMLVYSVADRQTGKVLYHVEQVALRSCKFRVGDAGRRRVIAEQSKNVHARIYGETCEVSQPRDQFAVTYNPYKYTNFVRRSDESVVKSTDFVFAGQLGVYAW